MPYRTPYRTRRVPVAQDLEWEKLPLHEPEFFGLGEKPIDFPEIEATYSFETAREEAARCYRCDAETGSADYSVQHREDIFSMARTNPMDHAKHQAMFQRRLRPRQNPFPAGRPATLDDLTFLPANLSRLVIDPYREACRVSTDIGVRYELAQPFFVTGFDSAPAEVREAVAAGLKASNCGYIGVKAIGESVPWFQLVTPTGIKQGIKPSKDAAALIFTGDEFESIEIERLFADQLIGLAMSSLAALERVIPYVLEQKFDMLLLDGTANLDGEWPELASAPDLRILRDAIAILRRLKQEEAIDLVYFGGARSGTDAAKLIALGAKAVVFGAAVGLAVGGEIVGGNRLRFASDYSDLDRSQATVNIIKASAGEASMMARCTGKTNLQNLEPEDLRSITLVTAEATGIPLVGLHAEPTRLVAS